MSVCVSEANVEGCGANSASSDFCAKAEKGPAVLQVRRWLNLVQRCMTTAVQVPLPLGSQLAELGLAPLGCQLRFGRWLILSSPLAEILLSH
jgi:hypothetical protein